VRWSGGRGAAGTRRRRRRQRRRRRWRPELPAWSGDLMATAGAAAIGVCLSVAAALQRAWAPLWIYAFSVTASAAAVAALSRLRRQRQRRATQGCAARPPLCSDGWLTHTSWASLWGPPLSRVSVGHTFANATSTQGASAGRRGGLGATNRSSPTQEAPPRPASFAAGDLALISSLRHAL